MDTLYFTEPEKRDFIGSPCISGMLRVLPIEEAFTIRRKSGLYTTYKNCGLLHFPGNVI